ncbi:MAG TPA: hypothetical protein PLD49_00380 [Thermoclostridium caenicola]|uniref:Uncharacterized protein n=1 Tax=Thermoclostridium caenicola TaxID=659425 RepID=A0A1M6F3W0_9FIRM|nr:hypothetical protein [Thermoclostridium caenicola]SHI92434.1 hypothetical protein SAMN05444373_101521 [Thermoclostridium caenicola]HOK42112.1 hypothetical protein [Thermoclostridium caenicola]HOL84009.1 hypothetical protein [Thermoclostridium caenicola]HOP72112.1 hypothetical protein [Thermoclostridium caenicola]HPO75591.1 hypothetical protein [Thermoclostridium caenicola]
MKMSGKLYKGATILDERIVDVDDESGTYQDRLEQCLVALCSQLSIEVPLWLTKNTREYVRFRRTSFNADQFFSAVHFDRFEIRIVE